MLNTITSLLKQIFDPSNTNQAPESPNLAIASLLCEVAQADHQLETSEEKIQISLMMRLLDLTKEEAVDLFAQAKEQVAKSASLYDFTSQLRELSHDLRYELIKSMWDVAQVDGEIDPLEDAVIRKTAELLYVDHQSFIRAKLQSQEA